jgi:hypothetical protein
MRPLAERKIRDPACVRLDDPQHLRHWTRALGCNVRELRDAVAAVGSQAANVRMRFRPRPMTRRRPV